MGRLLRARLAILVGAALLALLAAGALALTATSVADTTEPDAEAASTPAAIPANLPAIAGHFGAVVNEGKALVAFEWARTTAQRASTLIGRQDIGPEESMKPVDVIVMNGDFRYADEDGVRAITSVVVLVDAQTGRPSVVSYRSEATDTSAVGTMQSISIESAE